MPLFRYLRLLAVAVLVTLGSASVAEAQLNAQEQKIANLMMSNSGQKRPFLQVDATLSRVARARAMDMAKRHYFAHVNPDGKGPNYLVRQAGYTLPDGYDQSASGNNIESCAAGSSTPEATWSQWMGSSAHKSHLLAQNAFYTDQTSLGVGYYADASSPYLYYWVVLTAPPPGPALSITSPLSNAALTVPQATVTGTTGGAPATTRVAWRLENSAGTTAYANATGTSSWMAAVSGLVPGTNTVRVQSFNGSTLLLEQTRSFRYVVLKPLVVSAEGTGTLTTGFLGTTQRELGARYSIAAKPATGWLFDHWSGSVNSTAATAAFTMAEGFTLTAHFRVNPFYVLKGSYNGLIQGDTADHATSGFLKATVTVAGGFSGKLTLGGKAYALSGKFDANGAAQVTIKRVGLAPLVVSLQLDMMGGTQAITGSVTDGTFVTEISADHALPAGSKHFAAGRYTVSFPSSPDAPEAPQGSGYGVLTVSTLGAATLSGTLADGRIFSAAATVSKDGKLPLYASLLVGTGSLAGEATFNPETGALTGNVLWTKPERLTDKLFPAAFATELPVTGARYVAPKAGTPVMSVITALNNSALQLEGGDLQSEVDQSATLLPTNVVAIVNPQLPKLVLSITPSTGRFTGSFTHPVTKVISRINGVILQDRNAATGFFLGQTESGTAIFSPAQ